MKLYSIEKPPAGSQVICKNLPGGDGLKEGRGNE